MLDNLNQPQSKTNSLMHERNIKNIIIASSQVAKIPLIMVDVVYVSNAIFSRFEAAHLKYLIYWDKIKYKGE